MRSPTVLSSVICLFLFPLSLSTTASENEPIESLQFTRGDLTVTDLVSIYGLNIYKFHLQSPGQGEYKVVLREKLNKDKPWKNLFSEVLQGINRTNAILTVSFTRVDGQFGRVFFTDEKRAEFSVKCCDEKKCFAGISTIVTVPLQDQDGMVLSVHRSAADNPAKNPDEVALFTMKPSGRLARKTGDADFPRAELLLQKVKQ